MAAAEDLAKTESAATLARRIRRKESIAGRGRGRGDRPDRGAQSEDQCADHLRLRRRAEGGEGGGSRDHARRQGRPAARRADRHEGLLRLQAGLGHDIRRHPRARELRRRPLLHVRRADGEGRRDLRRQDQQPGLRLPRHLRQLSLRPVEKSVRLDEEHRRLVRRQRRRGGGGTAAALRGHRRRRLDPHPVLLVRRLSATSPPSGACRW